MKKRVMLNLFLNTLSSEDTTFLKELKKKSVHVSDEEPNHATIHDCGHDEGKPCVNVEQL